MQTATTARIGKPIEVNFDSDWNYPCSRQAWHLHLPDADASTKPIDVAGFDAEILTPVDGRRQNRRCYPVQIDDDQSASILLPAIVATSQSESAWLLVNSDVAPAIESESSVRVQWDAPIDPELVLFDVDGTLVDSLPAYIEVGRLAAQAHGYSLSEQFVRDTMNRNNDAFWELVVGEDEDNRDQIIASLRAEAKRHWPRLVENMVRPFDNVDACLGTLVQSNIKIGVVTASGGSSMSALAKSTQQMFDVVITRHDVTAQKPAPDGICKAIDRLGADPAKTIYVGDSVVDVQAATAAGVDCVAVNTGAGRTEDLAAAGPRRLISRLDALPELIRSR